MHFDQARGPERMRIYAIGDVHGHLDLLAHMHRRIAAEIERDRPSDWRIVHLGDYVDRGPDSKGVLDFLTSVCAADCTRMVALAGNHDIGFLDFLAEPSADGLFALNGGCETAASYGVELDFRTPDALRIGHEALLRAVPDAHLRFLQGLGRSTEFGDYFFCHAGIRPGIPLADQDLEDLIWIRREFLNHDGLHPKLIVHGHTPTAAVEVKPNRINIDTGAFHSGRLTALAIDGPKKYLLEVSRNVSV
jgi:serine/threonine protein phosphatase 1